MSVSGSFVESPKGDANSAILDELQRQALTSVVNAEAVAADADAKQSKAEGAKVEGQRAEAGRDAKASTESEVGIAMAETAALPAAMQIAKTGIEVLGESRSNPVDTLSKKDATGLGLTGSGTSFETMFKEIKSNPLGNIGSIPQRANIASASLGGQDGTNIGSVATEANSATVAAARNFAITCGVANEKVLGQVQAVRMQNSHLPQGPGGMGSGAPSLENNKLGCGPAYISPEQAERMARSMETDKSESWA